MLQICVFLFSCAYGHLSCLGIENTAVDWWVTYKLPSGYAFAYRDSTTSLDLKKVLQIFPGKLLNESDNHLAWTLGQLFRNSYSVVVYNDELPPNVTAETAQRPPGQKSQSPDSYAHQKGVWAAQAPDSNGDAYGFWLIHSLPKFPDLASGFYSWTGDDTYAQSFMCISFVNQNDINSAALQLQYSWPQVYLYRNPKYASSAYPNYGDFLSGVKYSGASVVDITTSTGQVFTTFSKSADWGKDLGEELVSPYYRKSFFWET